MSEQTERREFLKAASAALGGITISGVAASEAAAQTAMPMGNGMSRQTMTFRCTPDVTVDNIIRAVQFGLKQHGHPTCGIQAFDLHFRAAEAPEHIDAKIAGVADVTIE